LNKELKDMFFSLNLIESYGSGIRRAKDALKNNGSPKLKFYPDNDVDNYTNAVMKINKEFFNSSKVGNTTKETTKENENIVNKILALMLENPKITAEQIANNLENISAEGIRYHIRNLKKSGKIIREGSTKSGKWIVKGRENEQK
jgi:divergent AAA domain protein